MNTVIEPARFVKLRRYNAVMGALHFVQAIGILALANDFSLPVVGTFLNGPPGSNNFESNLLFDVRVAWGVAAF